MRGSSSSSFSLWPARPRPARGKLSGWRCCCVTRGCCSNDLRDRPQTRPPSCCGACCCIISCGCCGCVMRCCSNICPTSTRPAAYTLRLMLHPLRLPHQPSAYLNQRHVGNRATDFAAGRSRGQRLLLLQPRVFLLQRQQIRMLLQQPEQKLRGSRSQVRIPPQLQPQSGARGCCSSSRACCCCSSPKGSCVSGRVTTCCCCCCRAYDDAMQQQQQP